MEMIDLDTFEHLAGQPGVTLLDFTAAWCGPCKMLEPLLDGLARDYAGRVRVVSVDVERDRLLAARFDVRAMPTLVVWRDGREVGRTVGARPRRFIAGMLDRALAGDLAIAGP